MNFSVHNVIIIITSIFFFLQKIMRAELVSPNIAVTDLIIRLIGNEKALLFNITIGDIHDHKNDAFKIEKYNNQVHIIGTSGVAAANGFHYYLKNYCNCHISWDSDQLNLPDVLPEVNIQIILFDKYRYYQNVCAYSYSYTWWNWKRWEREIDWMAMNGINIALAFTGQEAIWFRIYHDYFNLTSSEIEEHFTGPSFFAWNRMGNIRGWAGPTSLDWINYNFKLQHKILNRMKSYGIIPILPAFCGHLPRAFKRLFPKVKMKKISRWVTFKDKYCCPYLIHPKETLFRSVGEIFMKEMINEFGATNFYGCDTFNEMINPFEEIKDLSLFSSVVSQTMVKMDSRAVWILQGWTFAYNETFWTRENVRNYLSGVPNDKMIVLDLQSEIVPQYKRLESYFGKPFVWCMLHNFGGNLGMHGSFDILNEEIIEARSMKNSTMIGIGIAPEGINQNYVIYDFMLESSWRNSTVDTVAWIEKYSERRYGNNNTNLKEAWKLLRNTVYNYKLPKRLHGNYTLCVRPKLTIKPSQWYALEDFMTAWDLFSNTSEIMDWSQISRNFQHDLIDINRQGLQLLFDRMYLILVENYFSKNLKALSTSTQNLLSLLKDLDFLLSTNKDFMLGYVLKKVSMMASSETEEKLFHFNVKNQITLWGPNGEIIDYATKQWNGVVFHYYYPRWKLFCDYLFHSLITGTKFNERKFNKDVFENVEVPFTTNSSATFTSEDANDPKLIAKMIYEKWRFSKMFKIIIL